MAGQPLTRDEELLALFNAYQAILELMVSHDIEAVEQAPAICGRLVAASALRTRS